MYLIVIPAGLEPTTTRTGIWHSIQLNYGTKTACVNEIHRPANGAANLKNFTF